jgi:FlaA1/EpsC-like NDP-sugar epimerase
MRCATLCSAGRHVPSGILGGIVSGFGLLSRRLGGIAWFPMIADSGAWATGLWLSQRLVAADERPGTGPLAVLVAAAAVGQGVAGIALGVYRGRAARASFDELVLMAGAVTLTAAALWTAVRIRPGSVPPSAPVAAAAGALLAMGAMRLAWRWWAERALAAPGRDGQRTLVFGAGEGGYQAVRAMLRRKDSPFLPVALLDDDWRKRHLRMMGVAVVGTRRDIGAVSRRLRAEVLLVAIPTASRELLRELAVPCREAGLVMKVLPSVPELIGGRARLGDIRDVRIDDVLGRPPALMDLTPMARYLRGKTVMVTGAGGSIGSELCRVLARYEPGELLMLDRDESALHAIQLSLTGRALLDSRDVILADIRDDQQLQAVFEERRPDVVFHAAALKHLPLLESYPGEAVKTNVWGTCAVLAAAAATGVERFVNISTDKAADPTSVLGLSKRITERVTAHGMGTGMTCLSVRFGNVLGSRGSVLHTFTAQARAGGPLTVTHPEVTRYFMTVSEAVHLVIAAGGIGRQGEVLVLDMGEPIKIDEVARRITEIEPVPIVYTGLRPGEKLHEQLFGAGESDVRPFHPLISHVPVPALAPADVYTLDPSLAQSRIVADLHRLAFSAPAGQVPEPAARLLPVAPIHHDAVAGVPAPSHGRAGGGD